MSTTYVREIAFGICLIIAGVAYSPLCDEVGERAPSPSPVVTATARADSWAAPARSLADGNGEDGGEWTATWIAGSPTAASTVTQSALTATVTAYMAIDPVPATPPAQRVPVGSYEAEARAWIAVYFPPQQQATAIRVASCETGGTFNPGAYGKAGEEGIFQVRAIYHGTVPADIEGQVRQAAGIVARHGWSIWSCA